MVFGHDFDFEMKIATPCDGRVDLFTSLQRDWMRDVVGVLFFAKVNCGGH